MALTSPNMDRSQLSEVFNERTLSLPGSKFKLFFAEEIERTEKQLIMSFYSVSYQVTENTRREKSDETNHKLVKTATNNLNPVI